MAETENGQAQDTLPDIQSTHNAILNDSFSHMKPPSPLITRRNRTKSMSERAMESPLHEGTIKYFCRQRGHGFITKDGTEDDFFVHISDIEGEFVPHAGDRVTFKLCACPPKMDRYQAVHVVIKNLSPGAHERWDQPPSPHRHPHPEPHIKQVPSME